MELKRVTVENFRTFFGTQSFTFASTSSPGGVSVIFALNGAGKSTLLNAFTWCLYEKFFAGVGNISDLVHWDAIRDDKGSTSVTLEFEHAGRYYTATRTASVTADPDLSPDPNPVPRRQTVVRRGFDVSMDGGTPLDHAAAHIERILPEEVARFVFFPAEIVETLTGDRSGSLSDGLSQMLQVTAFGVLERCLDDVVTLVNKELRSDERISSKYKDAVKKEEDAREILRSAQDRLKSARAEARSASTHARVLRAKLGSSLPDELRRQKANELDQLMSHGLKEADDAVEEADSDFSHALLEDVCLLEGGFIVNEAFEAADRYKQRHGDFPPSLDLREVKRWMAEGRCVCGRPLSSHPPEALAATRELERVADELSSGPGGRQTSDALDELEDMQNVDARLERVKPFDEHRKSARKNLSLINKDIEQLKAELKGHDPELDKQIAVAEQKFEEATLAVGRLEQAQTTAKVAHDEAKRDREQTNSGAGGAGLTIEKHRAEVLRETVAAISAAYREHLQAALTSRINLSFHAPIGKEKVVKVSPDFTIDVVNPATGARDDLSSGENVLLTTCIIGAIIETLREMMADEFFRDTFVDMKDFPVVLDGAISKTDTEKSAAVIHLIASLQDVQAVLLLNDEYLGSDILKPLEGKVGAVGSLVTHNRRATERQEEWLGLRVTLRRPLGDQHQTDYSTIETAI